jgi:filamin
MWLSIDFVVSNSRSEPCAVHVGGSPFELRVHMEAADAAAKVRLVSSEEVRAVVLGGEVRTLVDARAAGAGELTASCWGAGGAGGAGGKAARCSFEARGGGLFVLTVRPCAAGRHLLQVKYNGEHVRDGPFAMRVFAPPDATKVRRSGGDV